MKKYALFIHYVTNPATDMFATHKTLSTSTYLFSKRKYFTKILSILQCIDDRQMNETQNGPDISHWLCLDEDAYRGNLTTIKNYLKKVPDSEYIFYPPLSILRGVDAYYTERPQDK